MGDERFMEIYLGYGDRYSIEGKIVDINDRSSTLTISVTSPFVSEVKFHCSIGYYNTLHPPVTSKYTWISWVRDGAHPVVSEAAAYYNTNDKCFYKKESGSESQWERADFEDIYNDDDPHLFVKHLDMPEKYQFFLYKYMSILHKEQLCHFYAYAIDETGTKFHSVHGKKVARHPEDYTWIYDPDSFYGEKWDAESIDGLVKEILPSRECLEALIKRHDAADDELNRKKWKERWERVKSIPRRVEDSIGEYPRSLWLIITLGTFILGIVSFIASLLKD